MINKVILLGRLGQDAESKEDKHPIKFSMATSENFRDENEESGWKTISCWHGVTYWAKPEMKQNMLDKLKKGALIYLEGKIKTSEWTNEDGEKRKSNDITAAFIRVVVSPDSGENTSVSSTSESSKGKVEDDDDDLNLPF